MALMAGRYEGSKLWTLVTEYQELKEVYGSTEYEGFPDEVKSTIKKRYYYLVDKVGCYADRVQVSTPEKFVEQLRFNKEHGISSLPEWTRRV